MSQEAVLEFLQVLKNDEPLKQRFAAIEDAADVARIAKSEMGYDFTPQELVSTATAVQNGGEGLADGEGELSEEQLEAVAGGGWCIISGGVKLSW